jgi:hypothetical protein
MQKGLRKDFSGTLIQNQNFLFTIRADRCVIGA